MTVFPFYVLADRSGSMAGTVGGEVAIAVVNRVIAEVIDELSRDPLVAATARLAVLSFADDATVDLPLTRLSSSTTPPRLTARGGTSLAAAFETTAQAVATDLASVPGAAEPMVFVLTDGRSNSGRDHDHGWAAEHRRLVSGRPGGRPARVVPFGFGDVRRDVLEAIASDPTAAYFAGASASPAQAFEQFAELIFGSVTSSTREGAPSVVAPPGSRVLSSLED